MNAISKRDIAILRELARWTTEIANLPIQAEKRDMWKALNGLHPVRPMVLIDQICWNEMNVDGELTLQCEDALCREYEAFLRQQLYSYQHMPVDMVVEPFVRMPKLMTGYTAGFEDWQGKFDFGIEIQQETSVTDITNEIVGHSYHCQMGDMDDLEKIRMPEIRYLKVETEAKLALVREIFGDTIDVKLDGCYPGFWFFDAIVHWCGVEDTLCNMAADPEFLHAVCDRLLTAYLTGLDQLEREGLLGDAQTQVHCTGAYSDELENSAAPAGSAKRLWTFNLSQIFCSASPAAHEEFEADYSRRWYERFGLGYYGCCEPLHDRIGMLSRIPNIRKVSISPFANVEAGAEALGNRYMMSRKPMPAVFAMDTFDPENSYREIRELMKICRRTGTPLEIIQKDISTLKYKPERLWQWADAVMRAVQE